MSVDTVVAAVDPIVWWYLARASGLVAWAALAASMAWGIALATRLLRPHDRPAWLADLHRYLGGLTLVLTGVHLGALVADSTVHFGLAELVVPFASSWRPGAVALGVVSLYALVAVQLTSLLRPRLPRRWWQAVHRASYLAAFGVPLHAVTAGSDAAAPAMRVSAIALIMVSVVLTVARVIVRKTPRSTRSPLGST